MVTERSRAERGSSCAVAGDLRTDDGADALCEAVGPIDVLVANYGVAEGGSWFSESTDETAWFDSYSYRIDGGAADAVTP